MPKGKKRKKILARLTAEQRKSQKLTGRIAPRYQAGGSHELALASQPRRDEARRLSKNIHRRDKKR